MQLNPAMKILMENATTFGDRHKITALLESETQAVNNTMVGNLYKSAIDKAHIDFEDIPNSKGDLTRYSGYTSMLSTLEVLKEIANRNNVKIPEIETVEDSIKHIVAFRESFEKGFRLDKEFIILQYNTLVYACVESVSILIASYVDFVKRPDRMEFSILKDTRRGGPTSIISLEKFNRSVKNGDFNKVLQVTINGGKESLTGAEFVVPAFAIGGVLIIVPLIRELIFSYFYSRMKLSDYLAQQAMLLEINKQSIQASSMSIKDKNLVMKKQAEKIAKLRKMSDSIKVDRAMTDSKATVAINKENKGWTIDEVKTQSAASDDNGFQLL